MTFSDWYLNLLQNHGVDRTITVRLHTGDPGATGTANAVPTTGGTNYSDVDVPAAGWSDAAQGDVSNAGAVDFGVAGSTPWGAIAWYSLWSGNNFIGRAQFVDSQGTATTIQVNANASFQINAGTIRLELATAA